MYLGLIVEIGPSEAVCARPLHPYTRALIAAVPIPNPSAERTRVRLPVRGEPPSPVDPPSGCRFHPRCAIAIARCSQEVPALAPAPGERDRLVACHLVTDSASSALASLPQ
jgi:peptide/nickel transport system ATP-binding protein